jgi:hypothetical protein
MSDRPRLLTAESSVRHLLGDGPRPPAVAGKSRAEWERWQRETRERLRICLGLQADLELAGTAPVAPNLEVGPPEEVEGCVRRRLLFDPDPFSTVTAWLLEPAGLVRSSGRRPGILAAHGHGKGKDVLVGIGEEEYQHRIAMRLCQEGYVVIAPDWRGFGERKDREEWVRHGRDACNVGYLAMGYWGYHLLGLHVHDAKVCLDLLQEHPHVDPARLGMIGCSFGGTMTANVAALDERVKAAVSCCYLSTLFSALAEQNGNTCGAQYSPGLLAYGDLPEVHGLAAPRALMAQIGKRDTCFLYPDALKAAEHLQAIYAAAGCPEQCEIHDFDGVHEIDVAAARYFFRRKL